MVRTHYRPPLLRTRLRSASSVIDNLRYPHIKANWIMETDSEKDIEDIENTSEHSALEPAGSFLWDLSKILMLGFLIVIFTRYFLFQPFVVSGNSMEPNFSHGDYLIIDEISYRFSGPNRGDVIVLRAPGDDSQFFIKRIVGLPNETVVVNGGKVYVYGGDGSESKILEEDYLLPGTPTQGNGTYKLSSAEYFVLGDNRTASSDSRVWGALERNDIIGRVWVRIFPIAQASVIDQPVYDNP